MMHKNHQWNIRGIIRESTVLCLGAIMVACSLPDDAHKTYALSTQLHQPILAAGIKINGCPQEEGTHHPGSVDSDFGKPLWVSATFADGSQLPHMEFYLKPFSSRKMDLIAGMRFTVSVVRTDGTIADDVEETACPRGVARDGDGSSSVT